MSICFFHKFTLFSAVMLTALSTVLAGPCDERLSKQAFENWKQRHGKVSGFHDTRVRKDKQEVIDTFDRLEKDLSDFKMRIAGTGCPNFIIDQIKYIEGKISEWKDPNSYKWNNEWRALESREGATGKKATESHNQRIRSFTDDLNKRLCEAKKSFYEFQNPAPRTRQDTPEYPSWWNDPNAPEFQAYLTAKAQTEYAYEEQKRKTEQREQRIKEREEAQTQFYDAQSKLERNPRDENAEREMREAKQIIDNYDLNQRASWKLKEKVSRHPNRYSKEFRDAVNRGDCDYP